MLRERIRDLKTQLTKQVQALLSLRRPLRETISFTPVTYPLQGGGRMAIRLGQPGDVEVMALVEKRAYNGLLMWTAEDFYRDMTCQLSSLYLLAFVEDELAGFIGLRRDKNDLHVSNFVVDPPFQSRGIGSALFQETLLLLDQLDRTEISLEVRRSNIQAQRFYRRLGFYVDHVLARYYADNKEDALVMVYAKPGLRQRPRY